MGWEGLLEPENVHLWYPSLSIAGKGRTDLVTPTCLRLSLDLALRLQYPRNPPGPGQTRTTGHPTGHHLSP